MTPVNVCKGSITSCRRALRRWTRHLISCVCRRASSGVRPIFPPSPTNPTMVAVLLTQGWVGMAWHPRGGGQGVVAASKISVGCARRGHGLSRQAPQAETSQAWACKSAVRLFLTPASHMPAQATGRRGVRGVSVQPPGRTRVDERERAQSRASSRASRPAGHVGGFLGISHPLPSAAALDPNQQLQEPRSARNRDDEQRGASTPPTLQLAGDSTMLKHARIGNTQRAKHRASGDAPQGRRSGVEPPKQATLSRRGE